MWILFAEFKAYGDSTGEAVTAGTSRRFASIASYHLQTMLGVFSSLTHDEYRYWSNKTRGQQKIAPCCYQLEQSGDFLNIRIGGLKKFPPAFLQASLSKISFAKKRRKNLKN